MNGSWEREDGKEYRAVYLFYEGTESKLVRHRTESEGGREGEGKMAMCDEGEEEDVI